MTLDRRRLLRTLVPFPLIGGQLAVLSPLLRYVKPNNKPYQVPLTTTDAAVGGPQVVGS